jgi:hypothetical protein
MKLTQTCSAKIELDGVEINALRMLALYWNKRSYAARRDYPNVTKLADDILENVESI